MRITKHISFYYIEDRFVYINRIIDETNKYEFITDIFIHTNNENLTESAFNKYTNGSITIVFHDLSNINHFYLTWKCRDLLKQQRDEYDVFMYIEDDILVPCNALNYWLKYNSKLIEMNYNLGFVRIEVKDDIEYITDLEGLYFDTIIDLDDNPYCVNNKNPYCAFWIYNKNEFNRFVDSLHYDLKNMQNYNTREKSAIGLHGDGTNWYKDTVIPMIDNKLTDDCRIYHMPNNYANDDRVPYATIKFNESIKGSI